jgi:hypothetical protein
MMRWSFTDALPGEDGMLPQTRRTTLSPLLLAVALGIFGGGCAPKLRVSSLEPARLNLGATETIAIVQSEGRRSAREQVIAELIRQSRSGGQFSIVDRTEEGITVKAAGRSAEVIGAAIPAGAREMFMRVDVLEWSARRDTKVVVEKDKEGNRSERKVEHIRGNVLLAVTVVNLVGRALLAETEYEASAKGATESEAIAAAAKNAIASLLNDITPRRVSRTVKLDESDKGQKAIIAVAKKGNLARAIVDTRAYLERHSNRPQAHYNLAVYLDAAGEYEAAMGHYDHAIGSSTKKYYIQARASCAKRLADQQALAE